MRRTKTVILISLFVLFNQITANCSGKSTVFKHSLRRYFTEGNFKSYNDNVTNYYLDVEKIDSYEAVDTVLDAFSESQQKFLISFYCLNEENKECFHFYNLVYKGFDEFHLPVYEDDNQNQISVGYFKLTQGSNHYYKIIYKLNNESLYFAFEEC